MADTTAEHGHAQHAPHAPHAPRLGMADVLVRLAHVVQQVFSEVSRTHELTPQQAQLLCHLVDGPLGMAELGRALHLEKSSVTGLVDPVEKRGLVARVRDAHDRRACQVALTGLGERVGAQAHSDVTARLDALTECLPPAERERATAAITRIVTS